MHDLDFAAFGQLPQTPGQSGDDLFLAGTQRIDIDFRPGEFDSPFGHILRFVDNLRHVQQRLRRNTAAQQANAPQPRLTLDERHLHAQIGRQKRRRITTRTAAEDYELRVHGKGFRVQGSVCKAGDGIAGTENYIASPARQIRVHPA